jgi:hypothetical protein
MKKKSSLLILLVAFAMGFSACSTVKSLPANVAGASRARFVGIWQLTNVSYDGLLPGSVQAIFNQAPPDAFTGSTWNLTNSGNGIYTLADGTTQTIFWSYDNSNGAVFQFKKLYQGDRAGKVQQGYQLMVASIDGAYMTLKLPVTVGDKTAYVVLSFSKTK